MCGSRLRVSSQYHHAVADGTDCVPGMRFVWWTKEMEVTKYEAASWIVLMLLSDPTLYAMMHVPAMLLFAQAWGRVACPAVTRECDSGVFLTFSRTRADAFTAPLFRRN